VRVSTELCQIDDFDLRAFTDVAATFGQAQYDYVVTPNTDHLLRLYDQASFRELYREAGYVLLDSRFVSHMVRLTQGLRLPVCPGSDLTEVLFTEVIDPDDRLVLIGGSAQQARDLAQRYGLRRLAHSNPAMGFIGDPAAVDACLTFIEDHSPFRFCFLAVGSPQQEMLARQLKLRGRARGLSLCVGASINFLTGLERRAPRWMRHAGMEWLFRLLQQPRHLSERYLVRGPRIFALLNRTEITLRPPPTQFWPGL
jgi:exopolysaccharide biosynthesis WecB/TagA/CpsF family protein